MMFNHFVVVVSANELFSLTVVLVIRCLDLFRISDLKFGSGYAGLGSIPVHPVDPVKLWCRGPTDFAYAWYEKIRVQNKLIGFAHGTELFIVCITESPRASLATDQHNAERQLILWPFPARNV